MKHLTFFLILILLSSTGCQTTHQFVDKENLPGRTFNHNSHSITKSSNGVYVYKDNTVYDTTGRSNAFAGDFFNTPKVNFGPDSIDFNPKKN